MRASTVFASAAAFAVASAQSSSVDPFPQTNLLAQTNSLGVVTGQFSVATAIPTQPAADTAIPTQPAVETDVGVVETIPAVGTGVHTLTLPGPASNVNATRTIVVSANNSTTVVLGAPTSSGAGVTGSGGASGSGASRTPGSSGSPTGSGAPQQSTGAAAQVVAGSFIGFGAFLAAFL